MFLKLEKLRSLKKKQFFMKHNETWLHCFTPFTLMVGFKFILSFGMISIFCELTTTVTARFSVPSIRFVVTAMLLFRLSQMRRSVCSHFPLGAKWY